TQPQSAKTIGEIDGTVLLDDDVIGAAEALSVPAIRKNGAAAIVLDAVNRTAGPCRDDETPLTVEGETIAADHRKFLKPRLARQFAVGLHEANTPDVDPPVAAFLHVYGDPAIGRPLVDDVGRDVAEQKIAALAFVHPERALGEAEAAGDPFEFGIR